MVLTRSQATDSDAQPRNRWPMPPAKRKAPPPSNDNRRAEGGLLIPKVAPAVPLPAAPLPVVSLPAAPLPAAPLPVDPLPAEPPRARRKVSPAATPPLIPENMEEGERYYESRRPVSDWVMLAMFFASIVACVFLNASARALMWDMWLGPFANLVYACATDLALLLGYILCDILQLICFGAPQENDVPRPDEFKNPRQ